MRAHSLQGGKAVGVRTGRRPGMPGNEEIRASHAVISNASIWDTERLLPPGTIGSGSWLQPSLPKWRHEAANIPRTGSFVHLHLGKA